jgi:hypothetical protein
MVPQREVSVSPFDIRAGALKHLGQLFGVLVELALLHLTQLGQRPAGLKQRRAQTLGQCPKRLTSAYCACLGHTLEIEGRNEMRVQN